MRPVLVRGFHAHRKAEHDAPEDDDSSIHPTRQEIEGALDGGFLSLYFGLTPQGGARWEAMSRFDWNYHYGDHWDHDSFDGRVRN